MIKEQVTDNQIVYGTFNLVESVALRPILYWVPFYFVFKTVFIVWRESQGLEVSEGSTMC